jgi:hypothetical protein
LVGDPPPIPDKLHTLREREVGSIRLTEMLSVLFVTAVTASALYDIERICKRIQISSQKGLQKQRPRDGKLAIPRMSVTSSRDQSQGDMKQ